MSRNVVITGVGMISNLGDSRVKLFDGLEAGGPFATAPDFETPNMSPVEVMQIKGFDPEAYLGDQNFRPLDRGGKLSVTAAHLALADAGWWGKQVEQHEPGLILGTVFCGLDTIIGFDQETLTAGPKYAKPLVFANTVINAATGQTALWHGLQGINSTIAAGAVSGLQAITYGADLIRSGRTDALLTGGVEALGFPAVFTYQRAGLLAGSCGGATKPAPLDQNRNGFALGEGAAFLMLESEGSARHRGANILARVTGGAGGFDPSRGQREEDGIAAVSYTVKRALDRAALKSSSVDGICMSANGSLRTDRIEVMGVDRVFGASKPPLTTIHGATGEGLGVGGALQAAFMVEAMKRKRLPPISGLKQADAQLPLDALAVHGRDLVLDHGLITSTCHDGFVHALVLSHL